MDDDVQFSIVFSGRNSHIRRLRVVNLLVDLIIASFEYLLIVNFRERIVMQESFSWHSVRFALY